MSPCSRMKTAYGINKNNSLNRIWQKKWHDTDHSCAAIEHELKALVPLYDLLRVDSPWTPCTLLLPSPKDAGTGRNPLTVSIVPCVRYPLSWSSRDKAKLLFSDGWPARCRSISDLASGNALRFGAWETQLHGRNVQNKYRLPYGMITLLTELHHY